MHSSEGHWTVWEVADQLIEFSFFKRTSAHILAGWSPKIEELDIKTAFGRYLYQDMDHATRLRARHQGLSKSLPQEFHALKGWQDVMTKIDAADNIRQLIEGLFLMVKKKLADLYQDFLQATDPIADEPSIRLIKILLQEEREQITWAENTIERIRTRYDTGNILVEVDTLWSKRHSGQILQEEDWAWAPIDRMPQVVRPEHFKRGEAGALRIVPIDPFHDPKDIGIFLHSFLNEEYTTLELVCRNTYEHPDMPWSFHLDMARHASDEARHANILEVLGKNEYELSYGDYPIYTYSYHGMYQFEPCPPGSKKELLWRILLRETFHEGLALDSLAFEIEKRSFLQQPKLARAFGFLLADEVFHAASGLKWSRFLCDNDPAKAMDERELAHNYLLETVKVRRARFVATNLDSALKEMESLREAEKHHDLPFHRTINLQARQAAGFTKDEIQQILDWGYVKPND